MDPLIYIGTGALLVLAIVALRRRYAAFPAQRPDDYLDTTPLLDVRKHLDGLSVCEGVIFGPSGRVSSRFTAEFRGDWTGNRGVIYEDFTYDDGSRQQREWHLDVGEDGSIAATAPDVVGKGAGMQSGATVQMCYKIRLPDNAGGHVLDTVDWMYLTSEGTIINRSQFRKFGFQVAELVATIRKKGSA